MHLPQPSKVPIAHPVIHVLLGHSDVDRARACLGTWHRLFLPEFQFRIYEDGSLTEEDLDRLQQDLPVVEVVMRARADERIRDELGQYAETIRLRRGYINITKAFDMPYFCQEEHYYCIDSDILFWHPFRFDLTGFGSDFAAFFMRDRENSYSLRSWQKLVAQGVRLGDRINVGIIGFMRSQLDLDLLEWFVSRPLHRGSAAARQGVYGAMLEQTFWSMLGMRVGCRVLSDAHVRVMRRGEEDDSQLIGGHFTARSRWLLPRYLGRANQIDTDAQPVTVPFESAGQCTAWDLLGFELRRTCQRVRTRLGRAKK